MASRPASKWQLDCKDAFDLNEAWERGALRVDSRELLHDDFALARGEERPVRPLDFIRDEGRSPRDLIGTTYGTLVLASERLLSVLREHRFTGWTTFSVKVCLDHERELEGYDGFAVTGRCGPIDDQLSEAIVLEPPVPGRGGRPGLRGLCFPPSSWDGSDVFTSEDRASIFVVERVKEALERADLTNVDFRRLSEIERTWRADQSVIEAE